MKEKFARWDTLFIQSLKRDWKKAVAWIVGIGLFSGAFVPAFAAIAKDDGAKGLFETLKNPAMIAMVGPTPAKSAADYTLGAMYAHEMLLFCSLVAIVVSVLHTVSHTRKEEEFGLTEIVRSFPVGRQANSLAIVLEIIVMNGLLAIFIALLMSSFQADTITIIGSFLFGAAIGFAGTFGATLALVVAQIMPTSGGATGVTLCIVGLLYITRAYTDISYISLTNFNPLGWVYLTNPFTENNFIPLIAIIGVSIVLILIAFRLEGARDIGAGYFLPKTGNERAKKSLLSVHGLFLRLNRATIIGWMIAFIVMSATYGSIYGDMQTFLASNELMEQMFLHSDTSLEQSFTASIMIVLICFVAILPITIVNKLFAEENRLHLSQLFATKVTRGRLYWTNIGIAIGVGSIGVFFSATSLGATAIATMDTYDAMKASDFLTTGFNLLPTVLFFIGLASLALGWLPKVGKIVYIYLLYSFLLAYFEGMLELPNWILKTAVQSWFARMPVESFNIVNFIAVTFISIVLILLGYIGYGRRDMESGK